MISDDSLLKYPVFLSHHNQDIVQEWIRALRLQAENLTFEDKYVTGKTIGSGQFSKVYQCQNRDSQEIVAMKYIQKNNYDLKQIPFIQAELQIIKMISHPNIVEMLEIFESKHDIKIVMEQVTGGSLYSHLDQYKVDERELETIMYKLIDAIDYMHKSGIVHRDLKPENILVVKNINDEIINIKITDFGLSKIIIPDQKIDGREFCGTVVYVSPEICHRKPYGKEVDMWSAGVIFYQLLFRQLPFVGFDQASTI